MIYEKRKDKFNSDLSLPNCQSCQTSNYSSNGNINNNYLSLLNYTFLSCRQNLSKNNKSNAVKPKDYLYDLIQTNDLNLEIIGQTIDFNYQDQYERESIRKLYNKYKELYTKKKNLVKSIKDIKSKLLIANQINEEFVRKSEEHYDYLRDNILETELNLQNKEDYIKLMRMKISDVEPYLSNVAKNHVTSPLYSKYIDCHVEPFLGKNTELMRRYEQDKQEIINIQIDIVNIKKENNELLNTNECESKANKRDSNKLNIQENLNRFNIKVGQIGSQVKLIKNNIDRLNSKLKLLQINKKTIHLELNKNNKPLFTKKKVNFKSTKKVSFSKIGMIHVFKKKSVNNVFLDDKNKDKDIQSFLLPLDMTKKLSNHMDFSIVLNPNTLEESKFTDLGHSIVSKEDEVSNSVTWDISVINKL